MGLEDAARKLKLIERDTVILLVLFVLACGLITRSWASSLSLAGGGSLMVINFHFIWRFARGVVEREEKHKARLLAGLFSMFFVFLGAVAGVLLYLKAPVLPFFAGTLSLVVAIFVRGIFFP